MGTWRWQVCQPYEPAAFKTQATLLVFISVTAWFDPKAIFRQRGLSDVLPVAHPTASQHSAHSTRNSVQIIAFSLQCLVCAVILRARVQFDTPKLHRLQWVWNFPFQHYILLVIFFIAGTTGHLLTIFYLPVKVIWSLRKLQLTMLFQLRYAKIWIHINFYF